MKEISFLTFVKSVDSQLSELINHVICSICQEFLTNPVITPCGHSFCASCIKRVLSTKENSGCPLCKHAINRYSLENDKPKEILSEVFQQLPKAFVSDVQDLLDCYNEPAADVIKSSKLYQLSVQENSLKGKSCKGKSLCKAKNIVVDNNETESLAPVFKHTKQLIKYKGAKEKRLEDLISISQTDALSSSVTSDSKELNEKLDKIEKLSPNEKVQEWFKCAGNDIYDHLPFSTPLNTTETTNSIPLHNVNTNNISEDLNKNKSTMVRIDYKKQFKEDTNVPQDDPYEFIPSLRENPLKKNKTKKTVRKRKITKMTSPIGNIGQIVQNEKTASQKFDLLLAEDGDGKAKDKTRGHRLFRGTQSSSVQILDDKNNPEETRNDIVKVKVPEGFRSESTTDAHVSPEAGNSSPSAMLFAECKRTTSSSKARRLKLIQKKREKKKDIHKRVLNLSCSDGYDLGSGMERYLKRRKVIENNNNDEKQNGGVKSSRLLSLLKEIADDELIYSNRPLNMPIRVMEESENDEDQTKRSSIIWTAQDDNEQFSQALVGFGTQNELPESRILKNMISGIEDEINCHNLFPSKSNKIYKTVKSSKSVEDMNTEVPLNVVKRPKMNGKISESAENVDKITPKESIDFIKVGRLTPIIKRRKSSVVKLIFPVGLTSLCKKRKIRNCVSPEELSNFPLDKRQSLQADEANPKGVNKRVCSVAVQTAPVPTKSVEIQTSFLKTHEKGTETEDPTVSEKPEVAESQIKKNRNVFVHTKVYGCATICSDESEGSTRKKQDCLSLPINTFEDILSRNKFWLSQKRKRRDRKNPALKSDHSVEAKKMKKDDMPKFSGRQLRISRDSSMDSDIESLPTSPNTSYKSEESTSEPEPLEKIELPKTQRIERINGHSQKENEAEIVDDEMKNNEMFKVFQNIEMDLALLRKENETAESDTCKIIYENLGATEESDSDFFVEQTPPKSNYPAVGSSKRLKDATKTLRTDKAENKENENVAVQKAHTLTQLTTTSKGEFSLRKEFRLSPSSRCEVSQKDDASCCEKKKETPLRSKPGEDVKNYGSNKSFEKIDDDSPQKPIVSREPKPKVPVIEEYCLVASSVKHPEWLKEFVSQFKVQYSNMPCPKMTHLVVGLHKNEEGQLLPNCTPKLLYAMANNKKIVAEGWLLASLKANKICDEKEFEPSDPVGGTGCRRARRSTEKLFKNFQISLLGDFEFISKEDLGDLILYSGGTLIINPHHFSYTSKKMRVVIVDQNHHRKEEELLDLHKKFQAVILSRDFIVMSIQRYKLSSFVPYLMHSATAENLIKMGYPAHLVVAEEDSACVGRSDSESD